MADRDLNDAARLDAARTTSTTSNATAGASGVDTDLRRLSDLDDFEVADGHPDIRGWTVKTPDGQTLGKVDDLVVSVREMRVRYMDVDVDRSVRSGLADAATPKDAEAGHALVPIGTATLEDDGDNVIVRSLSGADLASYPTYARAGGITRDYEQSLRGRFGATGATTDPVAVAGSGSEFYENEYYDEARLYDGRRSSVSRDLGSAAAASSTGSAGDQARSIPVSREGTSGSSSTSGRDSVIRRREASSGSAGMGAGAADRATNSGIADRAADKLDNLKDRVDGNPASKPGPDATDRKI